MEKRNHYSTLRPETIEKSPDGLSVFYDGLIKPPSLLILILGLTAFLHEELPARFVRAMEGDRDAILYMSLLTVTLVAILRILQSLFLAKIDYSNLENGVSDIVIFGAVGVLMGPLLRVVQLGNSKASLAALSALSVLGAINFFRLWKIRIPRNSDRYDYPIEARIQRVNTWVCGYSAIVLGYLSWTFHAGRGQLGLTMAIVASVCVALILNMIHSQQLTLLPKLLLKNDPDSPAAFIALFRKIFWKTADTMTDDAILQCVPNDTAGFRALRTVRASRADVERIADSLLTEFGYTLRYVFATADKSKLRRVLIGLLMAGDGLGWLGYMSFYLLRQKPNTIGFIKVETSHGCWNYRAVAAWSTLLLIIRVFGVTKLGGIHRRLKAITATQPKPVPKEIRLAYIVIYPQYRGQGYASATVRMLINALIRNKTNDIKAEKLSLIVRTGNSAAQRLFRRAGFVPANTASRDAIDPFVSNPAIGAARLLECEERATSAEPSVKHSGPPAGRQLDPPVEVKPLQA